MCDLLPYVEYFEKATAYFWQGDIIETMFMHICCPIDERIELVDIKKVTGVVVYVSISRMQTHTSHRAAVDWPPRCSQCARDNGDKVGVCNYRSPVEFIILRLCFTVCDSCVTLELKKNFHAFPFPSYRFTCYCIVISRYLRNVFIWASALQMCINAWWIFVVWYKGQMLK